MKYLSKIRHPIEVLSTDAYFKAFFNKNARNNNGKVVYYDAANDDYIDNIPLSKASEIKTSILEEKYQRSSIQEKKLVLQKQPTKQK